MPRTARRRPTAPRWRRRVVAVVVVLAALLAYGAADVADVLPGILTARPPAAPNDPFPAMPEVSAPTPVAIPGADAAAPLPSTDAVAAFSSTLLTNPSVPTAGVLVVDAVTGEEIYGSNSDSPLPPASTTKLLTATAAVATAGADFRFRTAVVAGPGDQIVLVAGGDLTLAAGAGDPSAINGHAGLGDLAAATAAALTAAGTTSVSVGLDTSYYTGPTMPPRWNAEDLAIGDAMYMAPIAVNIGNLSGQRARTVDPAGDAAAAFVAGLQAAGITVTGTVEPVAPVTATAGATELAAVESAPLSDLVAYTLQHSENILSEALGRLVAHELGAEPSFTGAGASVRQALADLAVNVEGLDLQDTSGLSSTNRVSPRTLITTLQAIATHPRLGSLDRGLPVAGLEGTLSDRLTAGSATGLVAAKTGTLLAVVALSGYATTADGRLLLFAVLVNDIPAGGVANARNAVDAWVLALASCGCSAQ